MDTNEPQNSCKIIGNPKWNRIHRTPTPQKNQFEAMEIENGGKRKFMSKGNMISPMENGTDAKKLRVLSDITNSTAGAATQPGRNQ